MDLDSLLTRLGAMPEEDKSQAVDAAAALVGGKPVWLPNLGPQSDAYFSDADELLYGGQAGGGKSDLLCGLALTGHYRALILRRFNKDARDIAKRGREIAGDLEANYNGSELLLTTADGREIEFGGCQLEDDKERRKGRAKDFYGFDELVDFTESQYTFITTWNRSTRPGQRCRIVCATNPPTRPEGLWVIKRWGAWLDPMHPKPAKPGELRWYISGENDEDIEVDGPGPYDVAWAKQPVRGVSRTFIPSALSDNPDLAATDYGARLDRLPAHLRAAYRDGNFAAELKDVDFQVIPTAWILAAMERWTPDGWKDFAMTAMALDPAGGGADAAELIVRHGGWFAEPVTVNGKETADGSAMAARVVKHRRDQCPVVIDAGGGYGGSVTLRLKDNGVEATAFNGAAKSTGTTNDSANLAFVNKRAEAYWRFREALDPDQEGGSVVALPPNDELKADLAAPTWELTLSGIKLESKEDIRKRIGRSPGKGDVVVMALSEGNKAVARSKARQGGNRQTTSNMGRDAVRRRH